MPGWWRMMRTEVRQALNEPENAVLLGILAVALALRVWGIGFGLPYRYHPDEPQHVVEAARMLAERRLEPTIFNNPPLYKYLLMLVDAGFFVGSLLFGHYPTDFIASINFDPSPLYLLGRVTSAIAGTLTVLVTYFFGKTAYNQRVGLLAAVSLAVAFLPVRESHYAVNDALLGLLVTTSLLGSMLVAQRGERRDYALGAIAVGLALATKYTAAFTVVTLMMGHFLAPDIRITSLAKLKLKWLIGALFLVGASAILGSPYFLLKPGKVLHDISTSIYSYGQHNFEGWQIDTVSGYVFYLKSLWWGLGPGLVALSVLGIALALARRRKEDILLLSFPLLLYLFMGWQQMYFARFILPAIPPLLVLAASAAENLASYTVDKLSLPWTIAPARSVAMLLITVVVTVQPAIASIRHNYLLTQKDTRTLAKEWIEANILEGARIAVDWPHHAPPLSTLDDPEPDSARTYDVLVVGGRGLSDHPIQYYRAEGFQYLIASSNIYNIPLMDEVRNAARRMFYASLDKELELVHEVRPYGGGLEPPFIFDHVCGPAIGLWQRERPGPTIKVYGMK
jgi:4-amino-4-deoxy-L-arabinose transferase-like glycosyltransferase